jgi:hypothetical protein
MFDAVGLRFPRRRSTAAGPCSASIDRRSLLAVTVSTNAILLKYSQGLETGNQGYAQLPRTQGVGNETAAAFAGWTVAAYRNARSLQCAFDLLYPRTPVRNPSVIPDRDCSGTRQRFQNNVQPLEPSRIVMTVADEDGRVLSVELRDSDRCGKPMTFFQQNRPEADAGAPGYPSLNLNEPESQRRGAV